MRPLMAADRMLRAPRPEIVSESNFGEAVCAEQSVAMEHKSTTEKQNRIFMFARSFLSLRFLCVLCVSAVATNVSLKKPQRRRVRRGCAEKNLWSGRHRKSLVSDFNIRFD